MLGDIKSILYHECIAVASKGEKKKENERVLFEIRTEASEATNTNRDLSFEKKLWLTRAQMEKGVSKTQSCFFYLAGPNFIIMMYL